MLWKVFAGALLVVSSLPGQAQKSSSADEILAGAEAQAKQQHKLIFFEFSASWCGPCHALDRFMAAPEIAPILEKYFVFAKVHIDEEHGQHPELNTSGSREMREKFGGFQGVPFIVFSRPNGEMVVTSERPVEGMKHGRNIGYPDTPEEISWFMVMLKKSVPKIREEEARKIEEWLRNASRKK